MNQMKMNTTTWDAVIVGGGPAGLAAAIALRQRGLACLVVDAMTPPIDKACGEGLMPDALHSLARLGVRITREDGAPFHGISFSNGRGRVHAEFPDGVGIGVRRLQLHQRMVERAAEIGVTLNWGSTAELLPDNVIRVDGTQLRARWLIGADGQTSRFRKWAGLERTRSLSTRYGFRRHYQVAPWSEEVEVHWGARGQVYVTPVSADEVCIAWLTRDPQLRMEDALCDFPCIAAKLDGAAFAPRDRGSVTTTRTLARVYTGSNVLVGDASGSADAITGEGLATSFRQAVVLADCLVKGDLNTYGREHRRIARLPHAMAHIMLLMDRWPGLQQRALQVLSQEPEYFSDLLRVHIGRASLPAFLLQRGAGFAWKLLVARANKASNDESGMQILPSLD